MLRSGTWDEALAPFSRISGSDRWDAAVRAAKKEEVSRQVMVEMLEVPIMMSPVDINPPELLKPVCYQASRPDDKLGRLSLQLRRYNKASAKTKDLLHGTEEHMRELFRASIFSCWRMGSSALGMASRCA